MAVAIDTSLAGGPFNTGSTRTFNYTCGASANLLVFIWTMADGSGGRNPTSCSYNSVAMTHLSGSAEVSGLFATDIWYMTNPPTGSSYVFSYTNTQALGFQMPFLVSFTGVNTSSPFGTAAINGGTSGANSSLTVTGAGVNDMYIAATSVYATAITSGSSNGQTNLQNNQNYGTLVSSALDYILGSNTGGFSWTGGGTTNNDWATSGVAVLGTTSYTSPPPILYNKRTIIPVESVVIY